MGVGDFADAAAGFAGVFLAGGLFDGGVVDGDASPVGVDDEAVAGAVASAGVVGFDAAGCALGAGVSATSSIQAEP